MDLARRHRLTVHDGAYLERALRERLSLAGLDGTLRDAARTGGGILDRRGDVTPGRACGVEPAIKRYILTGAHGSGKTAILRQLERDGQVVVEGAATDVM